MEIYLEAAKELFGQVLDWILSRSANIIASVGVLVSDAIDLPGLYTLVVRWVFPVLAFLVLIRCMLPLLQNEGYNRAWGFLEIPNGYRIPLKHWENSIGRSKLADIVINLPFVSRSHAVLTFGDGNWTITDLGSKGGVSVNGEKIEKSSTVEDGDTISLAGADFLFLPAEEGFENIPITGKMQWLSGLSRNIASGTTFLMILVFQLLGGIQIYFSMGEEANFKIPMVFLILIIAECLYYFIQTRTSRKYIELELLIFFLCGLNLFVVASAAPDHLMKQLIAILLGIGVFYSMQWIIKDLGRARKLKYILVGCAIVLMLLNLAIGETRFGARNWINLGFITFQPMEFVKVAFVLAGTATLDKLLTTRNLTAFIGFSGTCILALILMRDLGTAVIFFVSFLVIAFMRSGDIRTIALISSGAVLGAIAVISFLPYIASRFQAWGHVWEFADSLGYQQTRTMIYAASGGLLGMGGGNGYLDTIPAADTDLVFGILCEEWGLLVALMAVLIIIFLAIFALSLAGGCKSSFYAIAACGAASIFLIQTSLNVFGSVDLLPLTGVTLPFISNGGSSMIVCWALLAFIKGADERTRPYEDEEDDEEGEDEGEEELWEGLGE
ncbi:FtsW/RodA/SpoVE family cell cycle protein [Sinanaerobacter chloroacetimidivorans]|uniref:FtsW/RodA/SpoVE family cell cycle protein n=1 Tax=Sinanaerobacter chloroacetimidivorans TaxID=2818044 RepID=A0A8J8B243_9FIRM|nr:FtsW/RodA/SpoVE family cell cycle protein [Sinanaerobacter chloroacetimidivorans]MBR0599393.1 FtsW/RodA/SpoVE family cell cycle protein [Sinanaerobacter chloroacetimidivorans]